MASWPKSARIRKRSDYKRVQGRGRKVRQDDLLALWLPCEGRKSRFGITVSKKVGGSVTRNRVKRRIREALRSERLGLDAAVEVVFVAHPSSAILTSRQIHKQVVAALRRMERQC